MFAPLKLIVAFIVALRATAFVHHGEAPLTSDRLLSPKTNLHMAAVAPAPIKKSDIDTNYETDADSKSAKDPGWLVRLYNDPMNKREFVARCLMEICGLDDGAAYTVMMHAHQQGLSVIGKYHREVAELYKMKLQMEGLFVDMIPADDED
eukprot:g9183.t1 g9183   contig36:63966-64510(+)